MDLEGIDYPALVAALARVCRDEGVRTVEIAGVVKLELAFVANPLAGIVRPATPVPHDDWLDAMGNQVPVLRYRKEPGK